ncbi:MAG: ParB/RepB/Spo0J family partition protein [Acidobacteria bacterium]|nr:ParB/RepB/Spo0J family partition protein [Acidobacteriota bacterium]MDW7983159.1 ParB/RepB/Spo0J family partition protein [Acidobacteriota bacterium]
MSKRGLPRDLSLDKDLHYVEALLERTPRPVVRMISIDRLDPNPWQPRQDFGDLEELAESIRTKGLLAPILVRPRGDRYQVVAGERRLRACRMAGLAEVPCIEVDVADSEMLEIALIENLQRKDLDPFEEAEAYRRLMDEFGYTHAEMGRVLGKARSTITETLSLLAIPEEIRALCRQHGITSRRQLLTIARQPDPMAMRLCVQEIVRGHRGSVETAAGGRKDRPSESPTESERPPGGLFVFRDPLGTFEVRVRFYRGQAESEDVRRALAQVLAELEGPARR